MTGRCFPFWLTCFVLSGCAAIPNRPAGMTELQRVSLRIDTFDVAIALHGETLWVGVARVNRMTSATYVLDAREAAGSMCLPLAPGRSSSYRLSFLAMKYGGTATDADTYGFKASIQRSDLANSCSGTVNSGAAIERTLRMRRGQHVEFTGEDDFRMSIRRR